MTPGGGVLDAFRLDGRVALVAGAGRGIGAASALALAEAGADVVLLARTEAQIVAVAERVGALGRRALPLTVDALDTASVETAVERAVTDLGHLDVVVNVVGGAMPRAFLRTTDAALSDAWERNVASALRLVRSTTPHLLAAGGGSVVLISSAIGHLVGRGYVAYGTVKGALDHATRLLAADLAPRIRVNAVAPGAILTEALEVVAANPEVKAAIEAGTPLHRLGEPEDIAAAVLYLASPASSYVTGQILAVDGGLRVPNLELPIPDL